MLGRLLAREGYAVDVALDGATALAAISTKPPDLVLLDVMLPGLTGFEVCRRVKDDVATRLTPVIIVTGLDAKQERVEGLNAGADDFLTKPVDTSELLARVKSLTRMKQYTDDLDSASAILTALTAMIEARDGYGPGHCHRMANYAVSVGRLLHVPDDDLRTLYRGGFLHDIGMLAIPDSVLRKPGPLTADEYEQVKAHTVLGDALCMNLRSLQAIRPIIRWHHERIDGSGYPDGLRGEQIPLAAQIVGVVDVHEAVTTKRPYQTRLSTADALAVLRRGVGAGAFRGDIVEAFVASLEARHIIEPEEVADHHDSDAHAQSVSADADPVAS
jgi:putative two-component system response regulator